MLWQTREGAPTLQLSERLSSCRIAHGCDPLAATPRQGGRGSFVSGALQIVFRAVGRLLLSSAALRGTQRAARQARRRGRGVALGQSVASYARRLETSRAFEPMAAALGIGLDVEEPIGNMIIDIGGGTTEIAVIALSGIVTDQSIRTAGDEFTQNIVDYLKRNQNILIGERTAEQIKIHVGSALKQLDNAPPDFAVNGRDLITGIPRQITINYAEVAEAIDESVNAIEEAILKALENTPPELASDIYKTGLYLTGGGALLRGLDKRIARITKLPVHIADEPLRAVVRGTGIALKNTDRFSFLIDRKRV